jgi:signal transduction histidine kinase
LKSFLTTTKKIVETHDGNTRVESEVGTGTTFFFTFPKQEIEAMDNTKLVAGDSR